MTQVPLPTYKAESIVKMVAGGCDYTQMMAADPDISQKDLFDAVMLALGMKAAGAQSSVYAQRLAAIRAECPRAYEKWTFDEDEQLKSMHGSGVPVEEMAGLLQRQVSAIRSRLVKLAIRAGELKLSRTCFGTCR